jgi:hypothetical protein
MPDTKITDLTALTTANPATDMFPIVDVSDTTMAASGTTKRISINNILACSPTATLASATITGDLTVDTSTFKVNSSANRVGILTASPESELDVRGLIAVRGTPTFPTTGVGPEIFWSPGNSNSNLYSYNRGTSAWAPMAYGASSHTFQLSGSDAMTLNSTGLGIGISPQARIHAYSASGSASMYLHNGTAVTGKTWYVNSFSDGNLYVGIPTVIDAITVTPSGNVGVGVTPSAWNSGYKALQVGAGASLFNNASASNTAWLTSNFFFNSSNANTFIGTGYALMYRQASGEHAWLTSTASGTAGGAATMTQMMTLDASGNLLVGTTSALQLSNNPAVTSRIANLGTGSKGALILRENEASAFWGGNLYLQKVRGTSTAVQSGDALGLVAFGGFDGTNYVNTATIQALVTGAVSSGVVPVKIQVVATSGGVELTNTATSWASISDERQKDIIETIGNAVAKVGSLRSVIGKYKTDSEGTRRSFLIAQDVQSVLPEAVGGEEGKLTVRYTEVIPLLVAAIKELTARVEALEA